MIRIIHYIYILPYHLLLMILFFFSAHCSIPKVSNACDPNTKDYLLSNAIIQVLKIPTFSNSCFRSGAVGSIRVTPLYPLGKMLKRTVPLEFNFDQVVSADRCTFNLGIANDAFSKSYEKLSGTTSKLTLTPTSLWSVGIFRDLSLDCTADNGFKTIEPYIARYSFADNFRFVSSAGSNSNDGLTETSPLLTIPYSISSLSSECTTSGKVCYVLVASGNYSTSSSITIQNQISLYGSYDSTFLNRNADPSLSTYAPSILADTRDSTGGTNTSPISTFLITGSLDKSKTTVDGFYIKAPTGGTGFSAGVHFTSITGSGIYFTYNKIEIQSPLDGYGIYSDSTNSGELHYNHIVHTGNISGSSFSGIALQSTGVAFSNILSNTITLNTCSTAACNMRGIFFNTTAAASLITKNKITLGDGTGNTAGVTGIDGFCSVTTPSMTISENSITGTTCTGNDCFATGIRLNVENLASKISISENTIHPGKCTMGNCQTIGISITRTNSIFNVDILSNTIYGGDSSASANGVTFGLKMDSGFSSFINFQKNRIYTGTSNAGFGTSDGIRIGATGTISGSIADNYVSGGSGLYVRALYGNPSSNIPILRNRFEGGTTLAPENSTVEMILGNDFFSNLIIGGNETNGISIGLKIAGGTGNIFHNTIIGRGTGSTTVGLNFSAANSINASHNLIVTETGATTSRYCVRDLAGGFGPTTFDHNALWDCPTAYYWDPDFAPNPKTFWCSTNGGTFASGLGCSSPMASPNGANNLDPVNPMFFDSSNKKYCLSSSTPSTIQSGTGTNAVTTDITGATRPSGSRAYGAYEPGSTCN